MLKKKVTSSGGGSGYVGKKGDGCYNEGAEENKVWNGEESQSQFTLSDKQKLDQIIGLQQEAENLKAESGTDTALVKPAKLKDAFLLRPPNNQVLLLKSQFGSKREATIYFPYPGCLKMQRAVDV